MAYPLPSTARSASGTAVLVPRVPFIPVDYAWGWGALVYTGVNAFFPYPRVAYGTAITPQPAGAGGTGGGNVRPTTGQLWPRGNPTWSA